MGLVAAEAVGVAAVSAVVAGDHMHPVAVARQAEEDRMAVVDRRAEVGAVAWAPRLLAGAVVVARTGTEARCSQV